MFTKITVATIDDMVKIPAIASKSASFGKTSDGTASEKLVTASTDLSC